MKCSILRDLLNDYIRGLTSEETAAEIEDHLKECEECRNFYNNLSVADLSEKNGPGSTLRKSNRKPKSKKKAVALSLCMAGVLGIFGFLLFARNHELLLPFDANRMFVETFQAAIVTNQKGEPRWIDAETLYDHRVYMDPQEELQIPENYETRELVRIATQGINRITTMHTAKTINRNGESVHVVYYCHGKSLWDSLFYDADLSEWSEAGNFWGTFLYGDNFQTENYTPQMREIYYLPIKNLHDCQALSEEEFDALRENATLVWKGVI